MARPKYLLIIPQPYLPQPEQRFQKVTKKKFKEVLKDFMLEVPQQYYKDIRGRRNAPKGQLSVSEEIGKKDFIRFNAQSQSQEALLMRL